jgi:ribosomal protein S18 acetylase RimI-like enzyme
MKIREATKKDFRQLIKLIQLADGRTKAWAIKKTKKYLKKNYLLILVAVEDGKIVGYVFLDECDDDERIARKLNIKKFSSVAHIAVHPDYRHRKIGSKLLSSCEKPSREWKKNGIFLDCRSDRILFYEKNKYKNIGYFIRKENVKRPRRQYVMFRRFR